MQRINQLSRKTPAVILGGALFILTVFTAAVSFTKIVKSYTSKQTIQIPEVKSAETQIETSEELQTELPKAETENRNNTKIAMISPTNGVPRASSPIPMQGGRSVTTSPTPTARAMITVTPASATASITTPTTGCVITLFGQQYDVTSLRSSHPGGDVFTCGADNSSTYQSAHGTNTSRMQQYLVINSISSGATSVSTGTSPNTASFTFSSDADEKELEYQKQQFEKALEAAKKAQEQEHEEEDD